MLNQNWLLLFLGVVAVNIHTVRLAKTQQQSSNQTGYVDDPFGLINARAALCPIVGFHGLFCPGDDNNTVASIVRSKQLPTTLQLPNSVGMAIDVSTGNLLLPALQLSTGKQQWIDPESKQIFLVPPEITLTETSLNDNSINVRIFRAETELVDVWLKNAEAGGWTGGQLAHVQNISDLYNNYFKDNQATAITQDLKKLYYSSNQRG